MSSEPLSESEIAFLDNRSGARPNALALEVARLLSAADDDSELLAWRSRLIAIVPGLRDVLEALPDCFSPSTVQAFIRNAQVDVPDSYEVRGLIEFLISTDDHGPAIALAEAQHYPL